MRSASPRVRRMIGLGLSTLLGVASGASVVLAQEDVAPPAPVREDVYLNVSAARVVPRDDGPVGLITGRAIAGTGEFRGLDVLFAIDASKETSRPIGAVASGADRVVEGVSEMAGPMLERITGVGMDTRMRLRFNTVFGAEVAAVLSLLDQLDERTTRVGLVCFAGGAALSGDNAWAAVELTPNFERVRNALAELIKIYDPDGTSDFPAGLREARLALREAAPRDGKPALQRIVLVAEGYPESPGEPAVRTEQRAMTTAKLLRQEGIRVHSYAVGRDALRRPRAATKVAEYSRGRYVAVENPADLNSVLPKIDLSQIEEIRITRVDNGQPALEYTRYPDGRFSALVSLSPGRNEIEIYARSSTGVEKTVRVTIGQGIPGAPLSPADQLELERLQRSLDKRRELRIETEEDTKAEPSVEKRRELRIETEGEGEGDAKPE